MGDVENPVSEPRALAVAAAEPAPDDVTPAAPAAEEAAARDEEEVLEYAQAPGTFPPVSKRQRALKSMFTFYGVLLVVMPVLFLVALGFMLRAPLSVFMIGCTAFIPATVCFFLIKRFIRAEMLPTSFLMDQIFIGAVPGVVLSFMMIFLVLAIISRQVFSKNILLQFSLVFRQMATLANASAKDKLIFYRRYRNTDVFDIVVYGPLVIAAVAAIIKEFAKLAVAFRCEQLLHYGPALGPRGALATAAGAGLGFATTEILGYSLIFVTKGVSFSNVGLVLLASVWLLPLHIGTAFYMGVAIAKKKILRVRASVFGAYLVTVIFSFLLLCLNLYLTGLIFFRRFFFAEGFSWWIFAAGVFAKLSIIIALIIMCRKAFNKMDLERYNLPGFEIEDAEVEE